MKTKNQIVKSILNQVNPLKRRDVKITVNVFSNFEDGNAIDKENKFLFEESIREISPSYFKGNHTFDVKVYEVIDRKQGSFDLLDVVTFYPNHGATKLKIQDFKDVFGYTYGRIEIHTVELEAHENGSVSVLNYQDEFNGRQLKKIPQNTPLMVQLHLKQDGYYELYDDALMIIDEGELKEYKNELDHQTKETVEAVEATEEEVVKYLTREGYKRIATFTGYKGFDISTYNYTSVVVWKNGLKIKGFENIKDAFTYINEINLN